MCTRRVAVRLYPSASLTLHNPTEQSLLLMRQILKLFVECADCCFGFSKRGGGTGPGCSGVMEHPPILNTGRVSPALASSHDRNLGAQARYGVRR